MRLVALVCLVLLSGCGLMRPMSEQDMRQMDLTLQILQAARPKPVAPSPSPLLQQQTRCRSFVYGNQINTVCD